ncbi:MAG: general secretion pathway protein GspB, partial [Candidatus Competibacteraceae bacterium]|nr:general secretion pathway protein GspB [Candidatus Competibacteraceae bacterium]
TEPSGLKTASTPIQDADSSGPPTSSEPKAAEPKSAEPVVQSESPRALPETPAPLLTVPWETDPLSRMATLPAPLVTREPSPEPAPRPAAPVEAFSRLPADFRDQLPRLRIDALAFYDNEPRRSFTLINLSRYQEGDRLDEGPVLESIERDGVVLNYLGRRFRVPLNP